MLRLVREMRAAILQLGDLGLRIRRDWSSLRSTAACLCVAIQPDEIVRSRVSMPLSLASRSSISR